MRQWALVVAEERFNAERLYLADRLQVDAPPGPSNQPGLSDQPADGDALALIAATDPQQLFGLATAEVDRDAGVIGARYGSRLFDTPPVLATTFPIGLTELTSDEYDRLAAGALSVPRTPVSTWLVSVALPIEAHSPAEAVREFWTYVDTLGPAQLPAYVSPTTDELAIQAFVQGAEANQDPEED